MQRDCTSGKNILFKIKFEMLWYPGMNQKKNSLGKGPCSVTPPWHSAYPPPPKKEELSASFSIWGSAMHPLPHPTWGSRHWLATAATCPTQVRFDPSWGPNDSEDPQTFPSGIYIQPKMNPDPAWDSQMHSICHSCHCQEVNNQLNMIAYRLYILLKHLHHK